MSSARSANAKIVMSQQRNVPKKAASAVLLIGKATRTVMITTITARAIGMAEIAVVSSSLCCGCLHGHSCWLAPPPLLTDCEPLLVLVGKKMVYKYCKVCKCLDPTKQTCSAKCGSPSWTNDGICDDNNNNCGCGWDKGDCCGDSGKKDQRKFCKVCKVLRFWICFQFTSANPNLFPFISHPIQFHIRRVSQWYFSVWIPKTQISHQRRRCVLASAVTQIGWATVFVTLATTTVAASGTKMIVA